MKHLYSSLFSLPAIAIQLAGCASVHQDAAVSFHDEGAKFTSSVTTIQKQLLEAQNYQMRRMIDTDANGTCRLRNLPVFIRYQYGVHPEAGPSALYLQGHDSVWNVLKSRPGDQPSTSSSNSKLEQGCHQLQMCEQQSNWHRPECATTCYSEAENLCVTTIAHEATLVPPSGYWAKDDLVAIRDSLARNQSPATEAASLPAFTAAITAFSDYLDLLNTASKPQPTWFDHLLGSSREDLSKSVQDQAKDLSTRLQSWRDDYNKVAPFINSPPMNGVSNDRLTTESNAIGGLIDVLNTIAEQNGSANAIHAVLLTKVDKNCLPTKDSSRSMPRYVCINQLMDAMKSGLSHDLNLTYTSNALADEATLTNYMLLIDHEHLAMRKATQEHKQCHKQAAVCDAARDYALAQAQDRLDELQTKIEKINPPTLKQYSIVQNQISKDIPQTIQKLEEAHTKLIDTWDKPDRKAEAKAAFMSVKALATSIADVAQLLK